MINIEPTQVTKSTLKTVIWLRFMASKARRLRSIPHPGDAMSWEPLGTTVWSWLLPHWGCGKPGPGIPGQQVPWVPSFRWASPCFCLSMHNPQAEVVTPQTAPSRHFLPSDTKQSEQFQGKEHRALSTRGDNVEPALLSLYYTPWGLSRFAMLHFSPLHKWLRSCKSVISCTWTCKWLVKNHYTSMARGLSHS